MIAVPENKMILAITALEDAAMVLKDAMELLREDAAGQRMVMEVAMGDFERLAAELRHECRLGPISQRGRMWNVFARDVLQHIELYTVPQYGDAGEDIASEYTRQHCLDQVKKYLARAGRGARPGEERRDLLKMAHYLQLAASAAD